MEKENGKRPLEAQPKEDRTRSNASWTSDASCRILWRTAGAFLVNNYHSRCRNRLWTDENAVVCVLLAAPPRMRDRTHWPLLPKWWPRVQLAYIADDLGVSTPAGTDALKASIARDGRARWTCA